METGRWIHETFLRPKSQNGFRFHVCKGRWKWKWIRLRFLDWVDGWGDVLFRTRSRLALLPALPPGADSANTAHRVFRGGLTLALGALKVCAPKVCAPDSPASLVESGLEMKPGYLLCCKGWGEEDGFLSFSVPVLFSSEYLFSNIVEFTCLLSEGSPTTVERVQTLGSGDFAHRLHIYALNTENSLWNSTVQ